MRFLIDECLSVELVLEAGDRGYEAQHVARVGKTGWKDWNIVKLAVKENFILVTNNAADFRSLYAIQAIHPGLVILLPSTERRLQRWLFRAALSELRKWGEMTNRVLEVDVVGDEILLLSYDLPST